VTASIHLNVNDLDRVGARPFLLPHLVCVCMKELDQQIAAVGDRIAGLAVGGRVRPSPADPPPESGRGIGQATVWIRCDAGVIASVELGQLRLLDLGGSVPWRRWRQPFGVDDPSGLVRSLWAVKLPSTFGP
jgi:hypothetical protein